jgi:hypothetical protein
LTVDEVTIGNRIHWTLNNSWLHLTNQYHTQTNVLWRSLLRFLLAIFKDGRSLPSGFPKNPWPQQPTSQFSPDWLQTFSTSERPTCLVGWLPMLMTLDGIVRVVSVVGLHFNLPHRDREIPGGNFRLRPHLGVADSRCGWCRFLGFMHYVAYRSRLLCSRNSSMDGGAVIVAFAVSPLAALSLWGLQLSYVATLCTSILHTAAFISEAGGNSTLFLPYFGRLKSISDFRQPTKGHTPLGGQWRSVPRIHVKWEHRCHDVVWCFSAGPRHVASARNVVVVVACLLQPPRKLLIHCLATGVYTDAVSAGFIILALLIHTLYIYIYIYILIDRFLNCLYGSPSHAVTYNITNVSCQLHGSRNT